MRKKRITKGDRKPQHIYVKQDVHNWINATALLVQLQDFCRANNVGFADIILKAENDSYYGGDDAKMEIYTYRYETQKEIDERLEKLEASYAVDNQRFAEIEAKERAEYERLRAKFG